MDVFHYVSFKNSSKSNISGSVNFRDVQATHLKIDRKDKETACHKNAKIIINFIIITKICTKASKSITGS